MYKEEQCKRARCPRSEHLEAPVPVHGPQRGLLRAAPPRTYSYITSFTSCCLGFNKSIALEI